MSLGFYNVFKQIKVKRSRMHRLLNMGTGQRKEKEKNEVALPITFNHYHGNMDFASFHGIFM